MEERLSHEPKVLNQESEGNREGGGGYNSGVIARHQQNKITVRHRGQGELSPPWKLTGICYMLHVTVS